MRSFEAVYPSGRDWACTHALGRRLYGNSTLTAPPPAHIAAPQEAAATHPHPFGVDADLSERVVVHGDDMCGVFLIIQNERQFRDGQWETKGRTGPRQQARGR